MAATRREKEQLDFYINDRAKRIKVRLVLYLLGCSLAYLAIGFWLSLCAFAVLLLSDLFDVYILLRVVRPLMVAGKLRMARRRAFVSGLIQGLGFGLATCFYFFTVPNPDIIFVIGCFGLGAVNAVIVLPQNKEVALARLGLYGVAPICMVLIQKTFLGGWEPVIINSPAVVMLLACMIYMILTFAKAGMENHSVNGALFRSREDLKQAYEHMARQQAEMRRLSQVALKANDTVIITDPQRRIVWVNEAFTRHSGYTPEEAHGRYVAELMTQNDPEIMKNDSIDRAAATGGRFRGEVQSIRKDGSHYWLDVNLFPIFGDDGEVEFFVTIERDVTEARKVAKDMAEARAQAEAGARAKAEFLANMSHEIRTPLTGVMGMAELLAETDLDDEQRRYADTIRGSSLSLMAIINDILDLSKLDAGRMELHPVPFAPEACFRETLDLLEPMARAKGLSLRLTVPDELPGMVKADDGRLRQVATNIIGNAIKFTEKGSVVVTLSADAQGRLCFAVRDTGIGISKDKQEQIFDHFTQAEASTTRRFGGSGLGLSISRHIVAAMGGEIQLTSELGKGATFCVCVPVDVLSDATEETPKPATSPISVDLVAGSSILIVEDNQTNRFLLGRYLKDQPVVVDFAVDGVDALEKTAAGPYDLVFMDVSMPRMGGIEATRQIRELPIAQPTIVALTAHAFDDERQACLDAGMDDFLTKPIRKVDFLRRIAEFQNGEAAAA